MSLVMAKNGQAGIKKYLEFKDSIGLVILDTIVSVQGGIKTLNQIREVSEQLSILIASGYPEIYDAIADVAKKDHVMFLQKPFFNDSLGTAIRSFLKEV